MRQVEGGLQARLTKLAADWSAGEREAAGEVLAELVGAFRAGMAARGGLAPVARASRAGTVPGPGS